jgi:hypothetical protein
VGKGSYYSSPNTASLFKEWAGRQASLPALSIQYLCHNRQGMQVTPGQSRALRGHVNKYSKRTAGKNLSSRNWRGPSQCPDRAQKNPILFNKEKIIISFLLKF